MLHNVMLTEKDRQSTGEWEPKQSSVPAVRERQLRALVAAENIQGQPTLVVGKETQDTYFVNSQSTSQGASTDPPPPPHPPPTATP